MRVVGLVIVVAVSHLTTGCGGHTKKARTAEPKTLTAPQIIKRMVDTYGALSSYEDRGVYLTHWPNKDRPDELKFSTTYKRPRRLRFDFEKHHPDPPLRHIKWRYSIVSDAGKTFMRSLNKATWTEMRSIWSAMGAGAGVSRGTSYRVPELLQPRVKTKRRPWPERLENPTLLGRRSFEGTACFVLTGQRRDSRVTLWVGVSDFLLRRIESNRAASSDLPRLRSEQIIRQIRTNGAMTTSRFRLPPVAQRRKAVRRTTLPKAQVTELLAQLRTNTKRHQRISAAIRLGMDTDSRVIPAFIDALADSEKHVRAIAANSLGRLVDRKTDKALRDKAMKRLKAVAGADKDEFVRRMAKRVHKKLGKLP